jgi:hypothetical protein
MWPLSLACDFLCCLSHGFLSQAQLSDHLRWVHGEPGLRPPLRRRFAGRPGARPLAEACYFTCLNSMLVMRRWLVVLQTAVSMPVPPFVSRLENVHSNVRWAPSSLVSVKSLTIL